MKAMKYMKSVQTQVSAMSLLLLFAANPLCADIYTWNSTAGGDMAEASNWKVSSATATTLPSSSDYIQITSTQSSPITLSENMSFSSTSGSGNNKNIIAYSGEMAFGDANVTLSVERVYWTTKSRNFSFTKGVFNPKNLYFENGNNNDVSGNTVTINGSDATLMGGITMATTCPNNTLIVTNGAKAILTSFDVGRNANDYGSNSDLSSSNNLFRVTGTGTKASVNGDVKTSVRSNNRVEVLDGAEADFLQVFLGYSQYDSSDASVTHVTDPGSTLLVSGSGTKLTLNPEGTWSNGSVKELTIGYSTGSNTVEVANGAELVCLSNWVDVANNLFKSSQKSGEEYKALGTIDITNRVAGFRFAGNVLRVKGEGSKFTFRGKASSGVRVAYNNGCADDNRIEVLDGAIWDSEGGDFQVYGAISNGVYIGEGALFKHSGYPIYIGQQEESEGAYFTVDGGTCTSSVDFVIGPNGQGSRLNVRNGGIVVAKDATFSIGGRSDSATSRSAVFSIAGAKSSASGKSLALYSDSTLEFDVPAEGFEAVPLKVDTVTLGSLCETKPTLRVTMAEKNKVKYVTLIEATSEISGFDGINLDLPEGAALVSSTSSQYDAKKLIVKLPTNSGFSVIVR